MGINLWDKITGNMGPKLTKVSADISTHSVKHLEVFTAEAMVIVELHTADVVVPEIARSSPGALATDTTTVIFVPTDRNVLPVKDPKRAGFCR